MGDSRDSGHFIMPYERLNNQCVENAGMLIRFGLYLKKSTVRMFCGKGLTIMMNRTVFGIHVAHTGVYKLPRGGIKSKYPQQQNCQNLM